MADKTEPTQAMPGPDAPEPPRPTQPTDAKPKAEPLGDGEKFDSFMGHGGQTDISDETEDEDGNPNATAQPD